MLTVILVFSHIDREISYKARDDTVYFKSNGKLQ